jgi:hypothetical protein
VTKLVIPLFNKQQTWVAIKEQLYPFLATCFQASQRWILTVAPEKRSNPQNRRYWGKGVLAQIAAQAVVGGKLYSAEAWHEQFKRQFIGVIELPNGSVIGMSSADLDKAEFSEFCAEVEAYAASELGVVFQDLPND